MPEAKNIVLFVTDDHAAWAMHHAGATFLETPHLDALAHKGMRFTQAFTPSPVCSPARACLMTGLPPSATGIHDWIQEYDPDINAEPWLEHCDTLPKMFQRAGYQTWLSGKWHLGHSESPPPGFNRAFGMSALINTHIGSNDYFLDGKKVQLEGNRSQLITDHALKFLDERSGDRPFFLNVGYFATHSPYHETKHDPHSVARYREETFDSLPGPAPHPWARNENGPNRAMPPEQLEEETLSRWRGYAGAVSEIDREMGRILRALEEAGELDDTLIIYTSDHGLSLGHHGVWGKGNATRPVNFYENNLRIPLLLSGPDIATGSTVNAPVTHYDTFTTLAALAGVSPKDGRPRPGKNLLDSSNPVASTRTTFHEYGDARAARTPTYKQVLRYTHGPDELFNLTLDPEETFSSGDPSHSIVSGLTAELDAFYDEFADPQYSGLRVLDLPPHNQYEPWRDGLRERNITPQPTSAK